MFVDKSFYEAEPAEYAQVTLYKDGSPMLDVYCDGVLYRKFDGAYYRRIGADPLNVLWFGLKNDGVTYNQDAFQTLLNTVRGPLNVYFPEGTYRFGAVAGSEDLLGFPAAISLYNRDITITGETGTHLQIDTSCIGIQVVGGSGSAAVRLENFTLTATGKDPADGHVGRVASAPFSTDAGDDYKFNGINLFAQGYLKNINVSGFSGHGVAVFGATEVHVDSPHVITPGTLSLFNGGPGIVFTPDDSTVYDTYNSQFGVIVLNGVNYPIGGKIAGAFSLDDTNKPVPTVGHYTDSALFFHGGALNADNCQFQGLNNFDFNGGCGLFIVGNDSNQGTYLGVSVRENGYWGILDSSFLGSHFVGAHGSTNGLNFTPRYGAFCTVNEAARSTWVGCYSEAGQGPSSFAVATTVIGGLHEAGIVGVGFWLIGSQANQLNIGQIQFRTDHWAMTSDGHASLVLNRTSNDNGAWGYKMGLYGPSLLAFIDNQTPLPETWRTVAEGGISIPNLIAAGVRYGSAASITALLGHSGLQFYAGDYYVNTSCDGTTPSGWRCIGRGTAGTLPANITGRVNSTVFEFSPSAEGVFHSGDTVQIGALTGTLLQKYGVPSGLGGPAWGVEYAYPQQAGDFTVTYVAPRLRAEGDGVGPLAQRPTMRADDAGWRYFDTDTNTWSTWSGTAWI